MGRQSNIVVGVVVCLAALLSMPGVARAGGTQSGLAVAVTADGSRLVAGGSNRVLYELDPATLEVKRRVWLGRQIMRMLFSPDGTVLVVESTKVVQWLKADTLEPFHTLERADDIRLVPALNAVAMVVGGRDIAVRMYSFADATEKAAVVIDRTSSVSAYGVSPDGKRVAVLYYRKTHEGEEKVAWKDTPEELKKKRGPAFVEFRQRHDGYGALYQVFDVATGEPKLEKRLWYAPQDGNNMASWRGDDVYVFGYQNECAKIDPTGEVTLFALGNGYNYAFQATPDGSVLWSGSLRDGSRTAVAELSPTKFKIDKLDGFPEYFKAFAVAADGTAFAGTSAFRVVRLSPDGTIRKTASVY